jgi:hypothetical protein
MAAHQESGSLANTDPCARILLLPHCLRDSNTCHGTYDGDGLQCAGCDPTCLINRLRSEAIRLGYKGVCVAPGGRLALRYARESDPSGIIAVACERELQEFTRAIGELYAEMGQEPPAIAVVSLSVEGCVDTEVDVDRVLEIIKAGCSRGDRTAASRPSGRSTRRRRGRRNRLTSPSP